MKQITKYDLYATNCDREKTPLTSIPADQLSESGITDPISYLLSYLHNDHPNGAPYEIHPIEIDGICHHPIIINK